MAPRIIEVALKPIPEGATREDRRKMYDDHCAEMARLNPSYFNADGTQKTLWQQIMGIFS